MIGMADELSGDTWGERLILNVAERIRNTRRAQRLSVRALADRTVELGHPVTRQALVNLEGGRKGTLSIDDLFVIAHALAVNPLYLVFDPLQMGRPLEVLPDLTVPEWEAFRWASSRPSQISSGLYEMDFDEARSLTSTRAKLDDVRSEIWAFETDLRLLVERGQDEAARSLGQLIEARREHEKTLVSLLERDGVQMNDSWFNPRTYSHYRAQIWAPEEADDERRDDG